MLVDIGLLSCIFLHLGYGRPQGIKVAIATGNCRWQSGNFAGLAAGPLAGGNGNFKIIFKNTIYLNVCVSELKETV